MRLTKWGVLSLCLVSSLYVSAAAISGSLPGIAEHFSQYPNSKSLARLVLTLPSLAIGIGFLFFNGFINKFPIKKVLIFSLLAYAIFGLVPFFSNSLLFIALSRIMLGLAIGGAYTCVNILIGDYFTSEKREKMLGYQGVAISLGGIVWVGGGGYLVAYGWKTPFLVYGFGFFLFILCLFSLPAPKVCKKSLKTNSFLAKQDFLKAFPIYLTTFILMCIFLMMHNIIPFILQANGFIKSYYIAMVFIVLNVSTGVICLFFNKILIKFDNQKIFVLVSFVMGIGYLLIGFAHTYWSLLLGVFVAGLGGGLIVVNCTSSLLCIICPKTKGAMVAGLSAFAFLGQGMAPFWVYLVLRWVNTSHAFVVGGVALFFLGLIYLNISKSANREVLSQR